MMRQGDRRHRILDALRHGPISQSELKRRVRDPDLERRVCRTHTWATVRLLANDQLVWIEGGMAGLQPVGALVLKHAEAAWSAAADRQEAA